MTMSCKVALPLLVVLSVVALAYAGPPPSQGPIADELKWRLPPVPYPADNAPTAQRVALGERLFFDPRLAKDARMSCATCHVPAHGWADGLPTAHGRNGETLPRATPSIVNAAYSTIFMWDGRSPTLESQALLPMDSPNELAVDWTDVLRYLTGDRVYREAFAAAYPGESIDRRSVGKAIASFERSIVATDTPFDRWLGGETSAMTPQQVRGFRVFTDPAKANCAACHQAPNFTDDGFHNVGLVSYQDEKTDAGRYAVRRVRANHGAFKTPSLRNVSLTAPYFHDGSAATLVDVVAHYEAGGRVKSNLSANMQPFTLTPQEREDLLAFLAALTDDRLSIVSPATNAQATAR